MPSTARKRRLHLSCVFTPLSVLVLCLLGCAICVAQDSPGFTITAEQITFGAKHHFFGYIGQAKTIAWNEGDRYIVAMRIGFHDRMPEPEDVAEVVLIDTQNGNRIEKVDETRAWNPQQGTMFYWNPLAPRTQFYFNDRDPETNKVFAVLYDIEQRKRVKEYRFDDTPFGNSGVAQDGHAFLGLNYGRMDRLRKVTGYSGAYDWTGETLAPENDGIFIVDTASGEKRLLVSFAQLRDAVRHIAPLAENTGLFINHTLWSRDSSLIYFYCRGDFDSGEKRVNVPCTIRPDGTGLTAHATFMGGHPEWGEGPIILGAYEGRQAMYNVLEQRVVGYIGEPGVIPKPEGDISLSPDGQWFANGYKADEGDNRYIVYRMRDGAHVHWAGLSRGGLDSGDIRIDPAPSWNRASNALLATGWTKEETRQIFVLRIQETGKKE